MVSVIHADVVILGDINTITCDLMCLIDSINSLKEEEPNKWKLVIEEFKRIANESDDNFEYEMMKTFITNLQDLY